jgi:hypothetical protein
VAFTRKKILLILYELSLDKEQSSYDDLLDALTPSLKVTS